MISRLPLSRIRRNKRRITFCTIALGAANFVFSGVSAVAQQPHGITAGFGVAGAFCSFASVVIGFWEHLQARFSVEDPEQPAGTTHDLSLEVIRSRSIEPLAHGNEGPIPSISTSAEREAGKGLRNRYPPKTRVFYYRADSSLNYGNVLSTMQHSGGGELWRIGRDDGEAVVLPKEAVTIIKLAHE